MDQVKFGPELISRLVDYLCNELKGCTGVGLSVWSPSGLTGPLTARGAAKEHDPAVRKLLNATPNGVVTLDDVMGLGLIAVPGSWGTDGPVVLTVYLDHPPESADLRVVEEIEPMVTMAAAVVEFCAGEVLRADQMLAMVQHRRLIEQAKGLLMAHRRCSGGDAFQLLVRASQHANVKLRDLCSALVLEVSGTLDETGVTPVTEPDEEARRVAHQLWAALHDG
ncbi:hypothetical protein Lesp02_68660 [Lentzea sp. NBRC 105346]|uniref:ANTAR domain-containing protein n=1 Tax=Lentzea sp. NBRC 105346 TaxID=3032205 RepID=UPI0024A009EC|nr:ANTAR domain-containing protein [Lentzea sp. NBRC 105346]GLZ34679.1 hypothetical protein Lesp02_68660 [Lentzea sp. NBRC 105346]